MIKNFLIGIGVLILLLISGVGVLIISSNKNPDKKVSFNNQSGGYWIQDVNGWKAVGTPPPCPEFSKFASFVDVSKATSVLYPGQMRSVGYEPTSGFRFDGLPNDAITVTSPIDGEIVQAARFIVEGDLQYVFDIMTSCGIMVRFDHILALPPKLQVLADKLPPPKENDNRSTSVSPPVKISQGETIATAVGIRKNNNTFISWTMYDFRQKNKISQNPTWASEHPGLYHYAICPFPYLPEKDQERIKALPAADGMSGKQSDFCDF